MDIGDTAEDIQGVLDEFWEEAIFPTIERSWDDGRYRIDDLTMDVVTRFFPEKECSWPPTESSPDGQKLAYTFIRREIFSRLGCEDGKMRHPERAGSVVPEGFICVSYDPVGDVYEEMISQIPVLYAAFAGLAQISGSIVDRLPLGYIAPASAVGMAATG